jgi:hypothetical protein
MLKLNVEKLFTPDAKDVLRKSDRFLVIEILCWRFILDLYRYTVISIIFLAAENLPP